MPAKEYPNKSDKEFLVSVKDRLLHLFLSYCDFTEKLGSIYLTQNKFLKLVEDANIGLNDTNALNIMISTTLTQKSSLIKKISFE